MQTKNRFLLPKVLIAAALCAAAIATVWFISSSAGLLSNQDIRQQASASKDISLTFTAIDGTPSPGQTVTTSLELVSKIGITGIEVVGGISGVEESEISFSPQSTNGLELVAQKIEHSQDTLTFKLVYFAPLSGSTLFSTTSPTALATVALKPSTSKKISLFISDSGTFASNPNDETIYVTLERQKTVEFAQQEAKQVDEEPVVEQVVLPTETDTTELSFAQQTTTQQRITQPTPTVEQQQTITQPTPTSIEQSQTQTTTIPAQVDPTPPAQTYIAAEATPQNESDVTTAVADNSPTPSATQTPTSESVETTEPVISDTQVQQENTKPSLTPFLIAGAAAITLLIALGWWVKKKLL